MRIRRIEDILNKRRKVRDVAEILGVTRKTVHKWKSRYMIEGIEGIVPKKPGPKNGSTWNRTSEKIEELVMRYGVKHEREGPVRLRMRLEDEEGVRLDQSTIYRILKRRNIRYFDLYKKRKRKKKLYTLGTPGKELQMDTSFPFGRSRKLVIYSAIDDCTRKVYSKAYKRHGLQNTKQFIKLLREKSEFKIESIRTDQGSEFSRTISVYLEGKGIKHIRNAAYHPE